MNRTLKIEKYDERTKLYTLSNPSAPLFKCFAGAFGWADPHTDGLSHGFLLGGERSDGTLSIFHEAIGSFHELVEEAVDVKDRFLLRNILCDTTNIDLVRLLYDTDGLLDYRHYGKDLVGKYIWKTKSDAWANFRDRDNVANLVGVPKAILHSPSMGLDRVIGLVKDKTLSIHASCPQTTWILDQQAPSDVLNLPLTKAMCFIIYFLTLPMAEGEDDTKQKTNPYRNL